MELKKITATKEKRLSKLIEQNVSINFSKVQKLIREKNVKVNGKRTGEDVLVCAGDIVEVYLPEIKLNIFYEDKDIVVVSKPRKIETINESGDSLLDALEKQIGARGLVFTINNMFQEIFYEVGNNQGKYNTVLIGPNIIENNKDFILNFGTKEKEKPRIYRGL